MLFSLTKECPYANEYLHKFLSKVQCMYFM